MIHLLKPHSKFIVMMGMSCIGKTSFSSLLKKEGYAYYSFDHQYNYTLVSLPEVSKVGNWKSIVKKCKGDKWILDNWSTEDNLGEILYAIVPEVCIYLLYDKHKNVLDRYRIPVIDDNGFYNMYEKMYFKISFENYKSIRFFLVIDNTYQETTIEEFREFIQKNGQKYQ